MTDEASDNDTDVLGIGYRDLDPADVSAVTTAHPRPDFKREILAPFTGRHARGMPPTCADHQTGKRWRSIFRAGGAE